MRVHTSGRKFPVAEAKPATIPVGSDVGAVLTARQSFLLSAGQSPVDAFLGGYRAGLLLAAALVALGGVAAYIGLRRRTVGRHAYTNRQAAEAFSVPGPETDTAPAALGA